LVYPPDFTDSKREVFLEGEAYFEVSQDKHKPFFVKTENFQVKVLGTKFGVQAYKDETNQNTVLLEGKVSLSSGKGLFAEEFELLPSQKAVISGTDKLITIANVRDAENYIAWIHGYLSLEDENFQGLINRISRYYNLEIEMDATVPDIRVSGKLDLKDDPKRILDGVSKIFNVKYEQKGEKITVHK
jgi:ferric-dicitrate binding protein FerR (iron transport regulator)